MNTIKVMDKDLANKIAAGEVIEGPISIVKELVENSIDALAKDIKIELIEAGIKEIKVVDDGIGMNRDDAILSLKRHATSKLKSLDELSRISSLGFRGEALPSIASISEFTLRTSKGDKGTEIIVKGGGKKEVNNSDARKGTTIIVRNMFYNTPARYKYLKNVYVEYAKVLEYINKIALANPDIKFSLSNDGKVGVSTNGRGELLNTINSIYGLDVAKKMIEIEGNNSDYEVSGYISYPEVSRSNRNHMTLIVNGRVVKNMQLLKTIEDAYHTFLVIGRHPIVVININGDYSLFDVNIHPSKLDIKFSKMDELKDLIRKTIKNKLETIYLVPKVEEKQVVRENYEEIKMDLGRIEINEEPIIYEKPLQVSEERKLPELYPVGSVHGTYLIYQNETGMFIIDQHAAKERINYEKYMKALESGEKTSKAMLIPITIELPSNDFVILMENKKLLEDIGFEIEEFGLNTVIIKSHPIWIINGYEEQSIRKIIDIVIENESFDVVKFNENIAITLSCKLSVKANADVSILEMEQLVDDLRKTSNPYNCPHGRPTVIEYPQYELEKLFKRVV